MSSRIILDADDFADILQTLEMPINKHAMHDQSSHGNWAGKGGGNNLSLREVANLQNRFDPLQDKVYAAERGVRGKITIDKTTRPVAPRIDDYESIDAYKVAYKAYNKKFTEWAVEQQKDILSKRGEETLDGSPSGIRKYVNEVIKEDWFVERFGDGSSLPPVTVSTADTNAAGRHILRIKRDRTTGVAKEENIISIDRQYTKNESTILHEISHLATAQSATKSFDGHGVEFANNHIYVVSKAVSPERANQLREAYIAEGVLND